MFLKTGYVKNDKENKRITNYFNARLPKYDINALGFREKLWLYKAYLWYSFLTQDFLSCYKYASKWVDLFYVNQSMIELNPVFFLRGNHYLLETLFYINYHDKFKETLSNLEQITQEKWFPKDDNIEALTFMYIYNNKFNLHFMEGSFNEGLPLVNEVLEGIKSYQNKIDEHHIMVFYYKIASLYFGIGDNKKSIEYLNKIISNKSLQMREDLLCFSRILSLVAHYEAGLDYNLDVQIKSTFKFLIKMEDLYEVQKEMIKFLKNLGDIYPHELKGEFIKLHKKLKQYEDHPYERRAFLYLDVISWLESKIDNKPVDQVIREKYLASLKT